MESYAHTAPSDVSAMFHIFECCNLVLNLAESCAEPNAIEQVPEEGHVGKFLFFPIKVLFTANKWSVGQTPHLFKQTEVQFEERRNY